MIRLILFILLILFVICIFSLIGYPICLLIGVFNKDKKDRFVLGYVKFVMRLMLFLAGAKVSYIGLENLSKDGESVVYIGNHRSFFDVIATYPVVPSLTGFIAKKEMKSWPFVSWWMKDAYCLFLDRKNNREGAKTILEGIKNVKNGVSMVIFPEGTRSKDANVVGTFHSGSFKLATKAGAKIIPVVYNNSGSIWEDHLPWIKSAKMTVEFLEPIETKDMTNEEISALPSRIHELVSAKYHENGRKYFDLPEVSDNDR